MPTQPTLSSENARVISENLKGLRRKRQLSTNELAEMVGITASAIKRYEAPGQPMPPSLPTLILLENALRVKRGKLLEGTR